MNIAQHVERQAQKNPKRTAILFEGKSVSYGVLDYCARALADSLVKHGVNPGDREGLLPIAMDLSELGFHLIATRGTQQYLASNKVTAEPVFKVGEGRPHIVDLLKSGKIDLIINTPLGRQSHYDEKAIRRAATTHMVPCITTLSGGAANLLPSAISFATLAE